jgi:pantoate--beta-alanine ligase
MRRLSLKWKAQNSQVGFVPTMGYLHAGHASLIHEARRRVGPNGQVVVSIYVNPTQFGPAEDLSKYPRDLDHDKMLCREAGVDVLFVPDNAQMYPQGYSTYVVEEQLARRMEGASRPTHFRGVTTVVAKLFNLVQPNVAVFGAKDFQQATIIERMVRDLNFPIKIVVAPTIREPDGLAMSSRNKYLSPVQREQALILSKSLEYTRKAVSVAPVAAGCLREEVGKLIDTASEARLDYVEFFDPKTLEPAEQVARGTQMALAVFIGKTRLIDNSRL